MLDSILCSWKCYKERMIVILESVFNEVRKSKRYVSLSDETILRICNEEIHKYKKLKQAVKAVKKRLHAMYGAYFTNKCYKKVRAFLNDYLVGTPDEKELSKNILALHASSKERLDTVEEFYGYIFDKVKGINSLVDIGCGFNPFFLPWIEVGEEIRYYATDISSDFVELINIFFEKRGMHPDAYQLDIICSVPQQEADVAFMFKIIPILEQQKPGLTLEVFNQLNVGKIIATFPLKSLSGKNKGMEHNYSNWVEKNIENSFSVIDRNIIGNELIYVIEGKIQTCT